MILKTIDDICEVIAGQSPPSSTYNSKKNGLPFYQGKSDFGEHYPEPRLWCSDPQKIAVENDILISVRAPVGPTNICKERSCIGRGLSAIRAKKNTYYKYVYYYLKTIERKFSDQGRGSTFQSITQTDIKNIQIPIPNEFEEQKRIAEILDKANSIRQKRRETLQLADEFLRSTFLEMFGDPVVNDKDWETEPFSELVELDRNSVDPSNLNSSSKYIGLEDIESETGRIINYTVVNAGSLKSNKFSFTNKHILYGKLRPYLNKVALPTFDGICSTDIVPILPKPKKSTREFIAFLMRHKAFVNFADSRSSGANLPRISPKIIEQFDTISPDNNLQQKFSEIVKKTEQLKRKYEQSLQESQNLFNSLMQRAFRGEL